jgi:ATP-dependent phosphofructokinase / diphosphate-dependent phosphofructokinase
MSDAQPTLAILVGGGPAPGINGVIASAAIEAINCGLRVIGLREGYRWLVEGDTTHTVELRIPDVSRIHFTGGSILRTSRTNPARDEATLQRVIDTLIRLRVRYLVCIGGDDTTYGAAMIAERARGRIGVATVPKTIDNDIPLPDNAPTFGFETARATGAAIIDSLMEDARTTGRWYLAVSMGRKSGSLALSMCKSAGATLAIIPEEFRGEKFDLALVVDTIVGAIVKRNSMGHDNGVAVIAEGIAERIDPSTLPAAPTCISPISRSGCCCAIACAPLSRRLALARTWSRRISATNCAAPSQCRSTPSTPARSAMARCAICSRAVRAR